MALKRLFESDIEYQKEQKSKYWKAWERWEQKYKSLKQIYEGKKYSINIQKYQQEGRPV